MDKEKSPEIKPVFVDGLMLLTHPYNVPMEQHIEDLRNLTVRDDDVFICAYPKAGTHWIWEVVHMLLSAAARFEPRCKEMMMMEFNTKDRLDAQPSPRIFNTHLPFSMLPLPAIKQKKNKVIHVYRNPKDTVVSQWFHFKQTPFYQNTTLTQFIDKFVHGPLLFGSHPQFLKQMDLFMNDNPDVPIFNTSFEEAKRRPLETVKRLAVFLGVTTTEELCEQISERCSFQNLKKADESKAKPKDTIIPIDIEIYRKGEVGDWKNHLTAEDEAVLDAFDADNIQGLTKFKMEYVA